MNKIRVRLVRSRIGTTPHQRKMLDALGMTRMNRERVFNDTAAIRGIIKKVPHLVAIVEEKGQEQ